MYTHHENKTNSREVDERQETEQIYLENLKLQLIFLEKENSILKEQLRMAAKRRTPCIGLGLLVPNFVQFIIPKFHWLPIKMKKVIESLLIKFRIPL